MFGALISATDPVAVVALLHELKTSKRFSTLVRCRIAAERWNGYCLLHAVFET